MLSKMILSLRVYGRVLTVVLLWNGCGSVAAKDEDDGKNATRGVDEFLSSLSQMIASVLNSDARYSQVLGDPDDDVLQSILGRPNGRPPADYLGDAGRPPFLVQRPPPHLENGRPYPPPGYPYRPGRYPQQNSIIQALSSISRHDDLRCVPRLLCEVSSGARPSSSADYYQQPGYYRPGQQQQQQQQSSVPFLSKDALVTLLTVLNFVDDSPLLMFGRAALLGYNAQGDPKSCLTAYPTCPRDPDQLINYLNNHNGGFFRFFNQQLPQYAPQYAIHQQPPYPIQQPPYRPAPQYQQQQYASQYQQPQQYFGNRLKARTDRNAAGNQQTSRILSGSPSQYYDVPSVYDLALDVHSPGRPYDDDNNNNNNNRMRFPYNRDKGATPFAFPTGDRHGKRAKMTFPDRTGTGGLRAELDQFGNYKGVYYADGAVRFVDDNDVRPSSYGVGATLPAHTAAHDTQQFNVGDRLPYGRRPSRLQFPRVP